MNKLNKQNRDRSIDGEQMTASWRRRLGGRGIEQKRTHGQQGGDCWGYRGIKGLNGNGKNIIKIIYIFLKYNMKVSQNLAFIFYLIIFFSG